MPTLYSLTAAVALTNSRLDLSDIVPDATGAFRWTDNDILRATDRALERISQALPLLSAQQLPVIPGSATYLVPAAAFYVDQVEYPVGNWPRSFRQFRERRSPLLNPPTLADIQNISVTNSAQAGSVPAGQSTYALTYLNPASSETLISTATVALATPGAHAVLLNNLPLGFQGISGRNLYRALGGGPMLLIATIPDTSTTTFLDTLAAGTIPPPAINATQGSNTFELILPPELWPSDPSKMLEITYAAKHTLDAGGTTLPERHWDSLALGTVANAMYAYLPQVNDNFEYNDGHLRDRVNDTKATIAWQTQCFHAMSDFTARVKQIQAESNQSVHQSVQWGDVPIRWERV